MIFLSAATTLSAPRGIPPSAELKSDAANRLRGRRLIPILLLLDTPPLWTCITHAAPPDAAPSQSINSVPRRWKSPGSILYCILFCIMPFSHLFRWLRQLTPHYRASTSTAPPHAPFPPVHSNIYNCTGSLPRIPAPARIRIHPR